MIRNRLTWTLTLLVGFALLAVGVMVADARSVHATGTSYYVSTSGLDTNPGSASSPWRTIGHAAGQVTAGDTVHVAAGAYTEAAIVISASGTAGSPITFISDTPLGAVVTDTSWHAFDLSGSYITLQGFEIKMAVPAIASSIIDNQPNGGHETITGNYVHELDNAGTDCWGGAAIDIYGPETGTVITGNKVANVGLPAASCHTGSPADEHAIYVAGTSVSVANNIMTNITGNCFQAWPDLVSSTVMNNDIDHCGSANTATQAGITIGWDGVSPRTNQVTVGNNIVRDSPFGIRDCCSGAVPTNESWLNNDTYGNVTNYFSYGTPTNTGGITSDPLYVNYAGGDYHLQRLSPAIDAGASTSAPSTDYYGTARPQGSTYDIGAVEYRSC